MIRNKIKINYMSEEDLKKLVENLNNYDDFWNEALLTSEYNNPDTTCIVAKIDNEIIGFASVWEPPDEIHINNIFVRKDMRNLKIGSIMLEFLIKISIDKKKEEITLEVNNNNVYAIKLYKKYDFKEVGRRKKYYNNCEDALIMTKKLN